MGGLGDIRGGTGGFGVGLGFRATLGGFACGVAWLRHWGFGRCGSFRWWGRRRGCARFRIRVVLGWHLGEMRRAG